MYAAVAGILCSSVRPAARSNSVRPIAAMSLLVVTLAMAACALPPGNSAGGESNPYVCNDNMHTELAQYNLCRGGGMAPPN
jgi:hypothetical protein